ncbi:MAG TPA: PEGA domain-containing protein [Kofleriaceae bacterium]
MSGRRIALALVAVAGVAHADPVAPADAKQAAADAREGRALMKAHKYAEACPKLEASQKLAPSLVTETELAECDVKIGKIASALAAYRDVIAREPNSRRRKAAVDLVAQLDQRVPRIIVNVEADAEVTLDGAPLAATAQGAPVDFGKHEIVATKPGRTEFHKNVTITDEGQVVTINAKLPEATGAVASSKPNANASTGTKPPTPTPTPAHSGPERSHRRTYAVATIGVGGAGLVTGIVFGALARSKWNAAKAICGGSTTCATQDEADAAGKLGAQAHSRATLSTIFTIAGGAVAAAGVVLYATAPSEHEVQISALPGPDGGTFVVSGRF